MTMMSDLSYDLVEEILCRVPITYLGAVRCTCKGWNALSKNRILCKAKARDQFLGFTIMDNRLFSVRFNLHGILNEDNEEFVDPSIKPICNLFTHYKISGVFNCDGLLLCVTRKENSMRIVVWNPYLGQTWWIQPRNFHTDANFALGYDNKKNHKILMFFRLNDFYEIYDFKSKSWSLVHAIPKWNINTSSYYGGVSLNGNTYFLTKESKAWKEYKFFLHCFDFTTERFGKVLDLPFPHYIREIGILSCVKEEKLSLLYQRDNTSVMEIWLTTKFEPNAVSWSKFLEIDMKPPTSFLGFNYFGQDTFFIDEEKKVVVVFSSEGAKSDKMTRASILGDNRLLKIVDLEKVVNSHKSVKNEKYLNYFSPIKYFCSYVPSLVQINQKKKKKKKRKCERKDKKRKRTNKV